MRLSTLDDCVHDALATRTKVADQINRILKDHREDRHILDEASEAAQRAEETRAAIQIQKRDYERTTATRDEMRAGLQARRQAMKQGVRSQKEAERYLDDARLSLQQAREIAFQRSGGIQGQRRRVCEDLIGMYPIEPVSKIPFSALLILITHRSQTSLSHSQSAVSIFQTRPLMRPTKTSPPQP
jgi:hypothetical protein